MGKTSVTKKQQQIHSPQGRGVSIEQHESHDDNLLPDAEELAKLKEIDPKLITWLTATATEEQKARHTWMFKNQSIIRRAQGFTFTMDIAQLAICAGVFVFGLLFLLAYGENRPAIQWVTGTTTIIAALKLLAGFRQKKSDEE